MTEKVDWDEVLGELIEKARKSGKKDRVFNMCMSCVITDKSGSESDLVESAHNYGVTINKISCDKHSPSFYQ